MPLREYGVLCGRALASRREGSRDSPHYQVHVVDDDGTDYRIAVNVLSQLAPSELLYLVDDNLSHPISPLLDGLGSGWHRLAPAPGGPNLDYIRANLFEPAQMRPLPPDVTGPDNDLADLLDHYIGRAIEEEGARLYAFGERWGPEADVEDKVFGFRPGNGVHDIHMNQGNSGSFRGDDGVWQDGGLVLHLPAASRWVGVFLAFQSQAWHTDDTTGHASRVCRAARSRACRGPDPGGDGQPHGARARTRNRAAPERLAGDSRPDRLANRRSPEAVLPAAARAARGRRHPGGAG